jgi:hypothetical protein
MAALALSALVISALAMTMVVHAAGRAARELGPTARSIDRFRQLLVPALVVVRTDRGRAEAARAAGFHRANADDPSHRR